MQLARNIEINGREGGRVTKGRTMRRPLAVAGRGITQGRRKIVASEQSNHARKMGNVPVFLFF
jgi:hypothetical protein